MTTADRHEANRTRRELTAMKQRVLPIEEQQKRAAARESDRSATYPKPPRYDPLAAVSGNPADKGTPQPVFIVPRFKSGSLWFTPPVACRR